MLSAALLLLLSAAPLTTVAEQSGYTRTGRYDEVEALCQAFPRRYPGKVRCEPFGVSPLGRKLLVFSVSADGTFSPEAAQKKRRPVLFFQGGIHAGEIDGKDAGFWLLRDVLDGKVAPGILSAATLLFVPVFNVDGHERFGPHHRPNQNGPMEMGWRVTSQNLNLNRDYMKADAPEMQAMLRLLHRYDPAFAVDLHVTDGAKFEHDVSVTFEPLLTGPEAMRAAARPLKAELFKRLTAAHHLPVDFYPSFAEDDQPWSGFGYGWPPPRFANAYWAANNRFGMLVETHSWKDYRTRVAATYDVCAALLALAKDALPGWVAAEQQADLEAARQAGQPVPLSWDHTDAARTIEFRGYAYAVQDSGVSGRPWIQYDDSTPQVWKVPYRDEVRAVVTLSAPSGGYLVPPPHAAWVREKLLLHGLRFSTLTAAHPRLAVESFLVEPTFRAQPYEGRQTVTAKGAWKAELRDLPAGTLFVPSAQPHLAVAMHLLEPTLPDSLLAWGFFNAHLEQKEYLEDYLAEAVARELLQDAGVRAEFERRLTEPAFAKDPAARLRFFAQRHPSWDAAMNLYPVFRVGSVPSP